MIVAYNALSVRPGVDDGAATYSINVLRHLPDALQEARIVVFLRSDEHRLDDVHGLELVKRPVRAGALGRIALEMFTLPRLLEEVEADVLVSPNESVPRRAPCRLVVVAQNLVYHQELGQHFHGANVVLRVVTRAQFAYYRRRMTSAYRMADIVVAVSEETARVLSSRAGLPRAKVRVVHEAADSVLLPAPREERERSSRLLAVSSLAPYKNLERVVDLLDRLRRDRPELTLAVVGSDWRGYGARLRQHVRSRGLEQAVMFLGSTPPDRLRSLYEESRALLHFSECESFGLPVVEAMRYGLPVVVADRSSLPEVAGGAALVVDPARLDDAAAQVGTLLDDPRALRDLAARGRERAAELSWTATAEGVAAAVRDVSRGAG